MADVRDRQINSSYGEKRDQMLCYLGRAFNKNHKLGLIARYGSDQFKKGLMEILTVTGE